MKFQDYKKIQNSAARILTRTPRHNHITEILKRLHWLPVKYRIIYKILLLAFQAYHKIAPQYICDLITIKTSNRTLRSSNQMLLVVPSVKLKSYGSRTFKYAAPFEWNKLPLSLKSITSLDSFKTALKTYLFSKAYDL